MGKEHRLSYDYPQFAIRSESFGSEKDIIAYIENLVEAISALHLDIAKVSNAQAVKYFDQNSAPGTSDLGDGELAVWKDADAGAGTATHYLVYNDNGSIVTFASEETV